MKVTVLESRLGGLAAVMLRVKRVQYLTTKNMFWKGFTTPEEAVNSPGCNWQAGSHGACISRSYGGEMSQRHVKFHGSLGGQGALRAAITMVVLAVFLELLAALGARGLQ